MRIRRFQSRFWASKRRQKRYFTVDRFSPRPARDTITPLSAGNTVPFRGDIFFSFAQWQYHNLWGSSEMWLLLIENYTQYPAMRTWNTVHIGNFWRKLRFPRNQKIPPNNSRKLTEPSVGKIDLYMKVIVVTPENLRMTKMTSTDNCNQW